jgi:ssDNA-binding Zn-finger/Zn-ribbon topoisomerase 1
VVGGKGYLLKPVTPQTNTCNHRNVFANSNSSQSYMMCQDCGKTSRMPKVDVEYLEKWNEELRYVQDASEILSMMVPREMRATSRPSADATASSGEPAAGTAASSSGPTRTTPHHDGGEPATPVQCPRCGGLMMLRRHTMTKKVFLGCRHFPWCCGWRGCLNQIPLKEDSDLEEMDF